MAVTKAQKTEILADLKDKLQKSKSIMFAHYIGMTVADVSELRSNLKKQNAEMKVAKKTLMQLAAKELNMAEPPDELLDGAVACILSYEDPLTGAQVAFKFAKTHKQVELIGGIWEGKLISKEQAVQIAQIPGREALLGMFAAMLNSPLSSFARGLSELAKMKAEPAKEEPKVEASASAPATADVRPQRKLPRPKRPRQSQKPPPPKRPPRPPPKPLPLPRATLRRRHPKPDTPPYFFFPPVVCPKSPNSPPVKRRSSTPSKSSTSSSSTTS
jgi:large subunit ribosomal protein L10